MKVNWKDDMSKAITFEQIDRFIDNIKVFKVYMEDKKDGKKKFNELLDSLSIINRIGLIVTIVLFVIFGPPLFAKFYSTVKNMKNAKYMETFDVLRTIFLLIFVLLCIWIWGIIALCKKQKDLDDISSF